MKVISTHKHVYADFALIQDGDQYYHCFFERPTAEEHGSAGCLIDTVSPISEAEYNAISADNNSGESWRAFKNIYEGVDVTHWLVGYLYYENRVMTIAEWEALCDRPAVVLMLAALT